jgi:hypothetical protein
MERDRETKGYLYVLGLNQGSVCNNVFRFVIFLCSWKSSAILQISYDGTRRWQQTEDIWWSYLSLLLWGVYGLWPLLTTKRDVFGYWRRRSHCCFILFTTSLVVSTVSFYSTMRRELGWLRLHFRVVSWSCLILWLLASWLLLWSLVYLISLFVSDRLLWSALLTL